MAGASQEHTESLGHDAQQETAATAGGGLDLRTLLHRRLMFSGSPVNTCVRLQIVIEEKKGHLHNPVFFFYKNSKNTHFSMCRTFSPYKMRDSYLSLCASTQIKKTPLVFGSWSHHIHREQKHRLLHNLKNKDYHRGLNNGVKVIAW